MSIRSRLLVSIVLLTLLPLGILTWIAAGTSLTSVQEEIVDATTTRVNWAGQYMEDVLLRLNELFYSLQLHQPVVQVVGQPGSRTLSLTNEEVLNLQTTFTSAYFANSRIIHELSFYIHSLGLEMTIDSVRSGDISYPNLSEGKWAPILTRPSSLRLDSQDGKLYGIHRINTFEGRQFRGAIGVVIHPDIIEVLSSILEGRGNVHVLNEEGQLLVGTQPPTNLYGLDLFNHEEPMRGPPPSPDTEMIRTDSELVFYRAVAQGRLTIIKTVPLSAIQESAQTVVRTGLIASALLMIGSGLLALLFTSWFSKPIVNLAHTMEKTTLLDYTHLRVHSQDEIGLLSEGYNSLMNRMKNLVEKEYQTELELRNARLDALHAQINPHFLYNTLQLIGGMAMASGAKEVYQVSQAVGDLFRYTTANEGQLVSLEKEIQHVRNYLFIQEMRYQGRCSYKIDIEKQVAMSEIPRFTLQPLIENAFEHGLQSKPGPWSIHITAKRQKRGVLVEISDNGVGLEPSRLRAQRAALSHRPTLTSPPENTIGLRNVDSRLRMHFGNSFRVFLFSHPRWGTRVAIKLPQGRAL